MTGPRVYPYVVVPVGVAPPGELLGLRASPVVAVGAGQLAAWVSDLAAFQTEPQDLLAHHRIVEAASAAGPALPVRFGTAFPDRPALVRALTERETALLAALERVGRRREVAVTLEWRDAATDTPEPIERVGAAAPGPGRRFLEQRAARWAAEERQRARAEQLAQALGHALHLAGVAEAHVKHRIVPGPRVALSCAVLTDAVQAGEVTRRVREAAEAWEDVRLHLAGPWPPYSFSDAT